MKSKVEGRNYAILEDWMERPVRINKKETDAALKKMNRALTDLIDIQKIRTPPKPLQRLGGGENKKKINRFSVVEKMIRPKFLKIVVPENIF